MKRIFTVLGTITLSLILIFLLADTFSLYSFGSVPTRLTLIYLVSLFSIFEYLMFSIIYIVNKKIKKEKLEIKKVISIILTFISLILILGFIYTLDIDWLNYYSDSFSAPFYVNVIVRGIEFLIPSVLLIVVSVIMFKKSK